MTVRTGVLMPKPNDGAVLVVGSITADLTTFSQRLPTPGETLLGDSFTLVLGGKGANQALAAGKSGTSTYMAGCIGTDLFSDLVSSGLKDGGVDVSNIRSVPGPTGIAHIRVDGKGENDIVMVPLANSFLSEEQIDAAFDSLAGEVSVLLTQLEIPWTLTQYAVRRAKRDGITVILDPAPAAALEDSIWPLVDIVTPNETEARILTGIHVTDEVSAVEAARWFIAMGAGAAAITMGSAGCVYVTAQEVTYHPPFAVEVVDTTAAGDAFAGYLGAAIAAGEAPKEAIRIANAAGALTVTKRGASPAIPDRTEVDALMSKEPQDA